MFKKIWQSFVRWFRKQFGLGTKRASDRFAPKEELPPLDDTDREYLFMQLLEGVAHGWQQPRAIGFFNKIRQRVRKSEWLEWLDRFGNNLLNSPVPNYELAGRMVQLSELDCGEIGDLAGEYGMRLLNRQAEEFQGDLLPIMEFGTTDEDGNLPFDLSYGGTIDRQFGDLPVELLIDNDPLPSPPSRSFGYQAESEDPTAETREITLEEFSAMLHNDPGLVAELAEQFGIETTDPQVIINAVVSQMQQQVQQISGDLTPTASETPPGTPPIPPEMPPVPPETPPIPPSPPETPPAPPENPPIPPSPPEIPSTPPSPPETPLAPPTPPTMANSPGRINPPPPLPNLEYKTADDPWSNGLNNHHQDNIAETARKTD